MRTLAKAVVGLLILPAVLLAQAPADRVERAKREGTLVLYTSLAPTESQPLADAFEKKYGVKVTLWRALSEEVVQRVITEAKGRPSSTHSLRGMESSRSRNRTPEFPSPNR